MSQEIDLTHRKSRYDKVKKKLDIEYKDTINEINTAITPQDPSKYSYLELLEFLPETKSTFNYLDLFAGAGGLSLGIEQAGFNKLCDVEILPYACDTLKRNFPNAKHYSGDITDFHPMDYIGDKTIHLVVGGPPCQGFSVAGKRNVDDQRNFLFEQYLRVVEEVQPLFFVLENVPGIITLKGGEFYQSILKGFRELGYEVSVKILEAADYGVAQLRTRTIFIGNRLGVKNPYPMKQFGPEQYKTIDEAISDLEDAPRCHDTNHEWTRPSPKMVERIGKVPPGGSLYDTFTDAYKRQRIGHPSMTIKENHGGTHIHYKLDRCISAREMARLQSFPDSFIFEGTFKQAFIQIGNAVPPLLAKNIGLAIRHCLEQISE